MLKIRTVYLGIACIMLIGVWAWASALAGFAVPVHTLPLLVVLMVGLVGFAALQLPIPGMGFPSSPLPPSSCPPIRRALLGMVGEEAFASWFNAMEFECTDGRVIRLSVPVTFLKKYIDAHYGHVLLQACRTVFPDLERVEVVVRTLSHRAS